MINKLNIDEFKDKGFIVLKDYIKPNLLESLKKALFVMFFHSLKKSIKTDKLEELIYSLEAEDHNKVYNIQMMIDLILNGIKNQDLMQITLIHLHVGFQF